MNVKISYLTVRLKLDKLIQKIQSGDQEDPFSAFIMELAADSRIDLETASLIIEKYRREKIRELDYADRMTGKSKDLVSK